MRNRKASILKRLRAWARRFEPTLSDAERHRRLVALYDDADPWRMASPKEQFRFNRTNEILRRELMPGPKVGSILEIGCGEGHQSEYLLKLCEQLVGLDVVPQAVDRARMRHPSVEFIVGNLNESSALASRHFDIVTACEVLYYFKDIPATLQLMSRLGSSCLVTYYRSSGWVVEKALDALPLASRDMFAYDDAEWHAVWWRSPR